MKKNYKAMLLALSSFLLLLSLTTCNNPFATGLGDKVDLDAPSLEITSHRNGDAVGSTFELAGIASDDGSIKSVSISMDSAGNAIGNAIVSGTAWSYSYDSSGLSDGDHEFFVKATDNTGKSVSRNLLLTVDNNPPTVLITTPGSYGVSEEFNKNIAIKGEASDTTRVKQVLVSLYRAANDSIVFEDEPATGTSSWYYIFDSTSLSDEAYYFFVRAEDYSGNSNSFFYHFSDLFDLASDKSILPNIEELNGADYEGVPIDVGVLTGSLSDIRLSTLVDHRMEISVNSDSDRPEFILISPASSADPADNVLSSPQRFSGFVEDDDPGGIDPSTLTISIYRIDDPDRLDPEIFEASPNLSSTQWSYSTNLPDGDYFLSLYAEDYNGIGSVEMGSPTDGQPATFRVSSFAPVVTVTDPRQGSYVGAGSTTMVTASVTGMGSGSVELDPDGDDDYSDSVAMTETFAGSGLYTADITDGSDGFVVGDGEQQIKIRAGSSGNYGTASLQLTGDIEVPTVDVVNPAADAVVNGSMNIAGTSGDNNLISAVYLWVEEDADPDLPADFTTWDFPDGTDVYNWVYNVDTIFLNAGNHTVHVKAVDAAGNVSADYSSSFNVNQGSDLPVISLSNMTIGGAGLENGLGRDASIIGLAEDDDGVDASTLQIRIDLNNDGDYSDSIDLNSDGDLLDANEVENWSPVSAPPGSDTRIASWSHSLLNVPQGEHSMQVRVSDINGSSASIGETDFIIDYGPPDLVITGPANGAIFNAGFTISGTASDANGVSDVDISINGGAFESVLNDPADSGLDTVGWSHSFTVESDGATDGDYSYQIQATDMSGGKTTLDRQLVVDATAPELAIEIPAEGSSVNGGSVAVSGTVTDNRDVLKVYQYIEEAGTDPPADPRSWNVLAGTYTWSSVLDSLALNGGTAAADYVIHMAAEDKAGNLSAQYARTITIDQVSDRPVIDFNDIDKDETVAANNVLVGATNLTGTVEDDDLIDPALFAGAAIEINLDEAGWIPVTTLPAASGKLVSWKHDISALNEGSHTVRVRARDNKSDGTAGETSGDYLVAPFSESFNWAVEDGPAAAAVPFILNIGPPTITIDGPANYSYHNSDVTVSGDATDANGVASVSISTDNGQNWIPLTITPGSPAPWSYTLTVASNGDNDGTYSYLVRAVDAYGSTGIENGQFTVDATVPSVEIIQPASGSDVNGEFIIRGTAEDNIRVEDVYIHLGLTADGEPSFPDDYTNLTGTYSWSHTFDSSAIGTAVSEAYTIRLVSVDGAGNSSVFTDSVNRVAVSVDQETDRPVIDVTSAVESGDYIDNILPASKQIGGTATDDDSVLIGTLEYQLLDESGTIILVDGSDWNSVGGTTGTEAPYTSWTHTFGAEVTDGRYQVKFRAADTNDAGAWTAGGYGWVETSPVKFSFDSASPVISIDTPALNGGYTNTDITISGSASDAGGIKSIDIQFNGGSWENLYTDAGGSSTDQSWSDYTFTVDTTDNTKDGLLEYAVSATDVFGKSSITERYIYIDTKAPEASIAVPSAGDIVNGLVTFRGDAKDLEANNYTGLQDEVWLYIGLSADDPQFPGDYTPLSGIYAWSYDFDTFTDPLNFEPDEDYTLHVRAVDLAGNVGADTTVDFEVDQDSDIPVFNLSSIVSGGSFIDNWLVSRQISGSVEDDDSVDVATIMYRLYDETGVEDVDTPVRDWGTTGLTVPSGDRATAAWSLNLAGLDDGKYRIQFRASDINDAGALTPDTYGWAQTGLEQISIDTSNPDINFTSIVVDEAYTEGDESYSPDAGLLINRSFTVNGTVTDGNGISTLKISTDGTTFDDLDSGLVSPWNHKISVIPGSIDDGTMTIYIRATDEFGKTTTINLPVIIDTTDPVISPTQPTGIDLADPINVNGDVSLRGTITEVNGIDSDSFAAVGGTGDNVTLLNTGSDLSWVLNFDSDTYAYDSFGTELTVGRTDTLGNSYDALIYRFPIDITVFDLAGNRGAETYNVDIDQDSDKPLLYLTAPSANSSVAGAFIVQGTVTDDDDIQLARIQVDLDDNGSYDNINYDLSDDGTITGDSDFENESVPVDIPVTNGSWNILMNQNNEFSTATLEAAGFTDPTGWIRIKLTPVDVNGLAGTAVERRIYVDSTAPLISGQGTALPVPASGSTVKGDSVAITARFRDDRELSPANMQISFDGGVSFQTIGAAGGTVDNNGIVSGLYEYDIALTIDTTAAGGIVTGGNGILQAVLKVIDNTYKQNSYSLQLNVDNTLPTGVWNYNGDLADQAGVYTFYGNATDGGDYLLIGSAEDTGTISGVEKVDVFFVKDDNFYNPVTGTTLSVTGNSATVADMSGNDQLIPFPPALSYDDYVISIDNRSERGIYDTDYPDGDGDNDGFQESLRSKGTYDEWFVYFDTTVFPDGPIDLYYLVYDSAGNVSWELVPSQMSNNPPSINFITIGGTDYSAEPIYVKVSGDLPVVLNVSDAEEIATTSYSLTIADEYAIGGDGYPGDAAIGFSPVEYSDTAFTITTSPEDDTASLSIDTTALDDLWYRVVGAVGDSDGNLVAKEFYMLVDNGDSTGPIVTIDPFTQEHAGGAGHIEGAGESPDSDGQADLSGTVNITGDARDGNSVSSISLAISQDGGAFVDIGTVTPDENSDGDPLNGMEYTWSFTWNTADDVVGLADEDIVIRATGSDGTNDSASPPELTVDVVPYISEVRTGLDNTLLKPARRSVRGWYPVSVDQRIYIAGYNLPTILTDAITIGGTPVTPVSGTGTLLTVDLTDLHSSGEIIATTNGVISRNHLNNNDLVQNQEDNAYNDALTDNRYLAFFDLEPTSYSGIEAVMRPQQPGGVRNGSFDWFYVQNNVDVLFNENKIAYSFKVNGGDFVYNSDGTPVYLFLNDSNSLDDIDIQDYYFYGSVLWGLGSTAYDSSTIGYYAMNWNVDAYPTLGVGNLSFTGGDNYFSALYTGSRKMSRYENLRILTSGGDAEMYNYVFYFDNHPATRSIAYFSYRTGTTATIGTAMGSYGGSTWYRELDENNDTDNPFKYNNGGNKTGIETPEGRYNLTSGKADSKHFAPFLDSSGTMHLVYWDQSANKLYYIYNDTPFADPNTGDVTVPGIGTSIGWSSPLEIDSYAGLYPDIVVDNSGKVHITYQDSANSTLKYAYLSSKSDTTPELRHVDGLFGAGSWNSISLKEDFDLNGNGDYLDPGESQNVQRPVISTYAGGLSGTNYAVKIAFPLDDPGTIGEGFDPVAFSYTGDWEVMVVPASNTPSANKTFAETDGAAAGTGRIVAGYNGSTLQSAVLEAID